VTLKEWNKSIHALQAKTPLTEKPKLTMEDIAVKIAALDREVKYLVNKMKSFRPKTKPKTTKESNATGSGSNETKTLDGTVCFLLGHEWSLILQLRLYFFAMWYFVRLLSYVHASCK